MLIGIERRHRQGRTPVRLHGEGYAGLADVRPCTAYHDATSEDYRRRNLPMAQFQSGNLDELGRVFPRIVQQGSTNGNYTAIGTASAYKWITLHTVCHPDDQREEGSR